MSERRPYLAANWKMQKTVPETEEFLDRFLGEIGDLAHADIVICPPFTALAAAAERCRRSPVRIAAQNMHEASSGAYTGEISAPMLTSIGVEAVILGHSERRALFAEADEALARKLVAAIEAGLQPILCVGESESEREDGVTEDVLRRQLEADLGTVSEDAPSGNRDRVRAHLGDRHREVGFARAGRGCDCLRPLRPRRARFERGRTSPNPLRRVGQAR